ncbi:OmpA family protein [Fodinibius sediminis]|uniref:Outer membrane protein OmpA n=1 Tax=Fodinibius sediminis TaxID=1214077 RepID=A0A521B8I1_9BACT|nr:OmpA family protein [Fodinibius sediminis]SMO43365.1 Outer membrane protein OmpA [Fodinibius sediminis]
MTTFKKGTAIVVCIGLIGILFQGCKSWSKTAQGGAIGAGAGGLAGAVIGKAAGNTVTGAIIGAAVGGAAGAAIGNYMDRQAEEIESELENAEVERVGEGIKITFDSGILFDFDSYALRSESRESIEELSDILKKYEDTEILFAGHTDSEGSAEYNQGLSEDRAKAVASYTSEQGVSSERMIITGYGEEDPVADNSTEAGRQQNRRVEIAIYANEELKEKARNGELGNS